MTTPRRNWQLFQVLAAAAALGLVFSGMRRLGDLGTSVVWTIALGLGAGVVYFFSLWLLGRGREPRATLWVVLVAAVGFRLLLFPLAPTLTDDLYRYRWEGRIQAAGFNPYSVSPSDPRVADLASEHSTEWHRMPGREVATIYPPLLELAFRATWSAAEKLAAGDRAASLVLTKLPSALADLIVVLLLAWWLRTEAGASQQLAIYAWNPLVLVEFAASGHNDALALAALVAATVLIIKGRGAVSTLALTAAVLLKWFAAVLLPWWLGRLWWREGRGVSSGKTKSWMRPILELLPAAALALVCAWPFWGAWREFAASLAYFASRWHSNNAGLAELLFWFCGSRELVAGLGAGVVAGLALWAAARRFDIRDAAFLLFGAILLLSPNAFPWYFTWVIPWLAMRPWTRATAPWLLLTVLQFLSYHVLIAYQATGAWHFQPMYLWLTYAPFFSWMLVEAAKQRNSFQAARS